ncbi:MAG: (E)-4-hydroxy-3-methylbut-2-enyl-diphosphate synthase [Bacteroidia bacterium]|nr:(E)-4-hydroxy-3-methylbut-2-enyl-diphosphate synthase [Bacteroidia bacterium]
MTFKEQSENKKYCASLTRYQRRKTNTVKIGDLYLGGDYPIRIQSMTTTDTMDTKSTVEQSIRMIEAGCELVRITAPSIKEAHNLENIKKELRLKGYQTPLVADIHFTPNAAEMAARIVEKVRINPGNFADKKKFENIEYTDAAYNGELERIRERFLPLIKICKEYGTAMRIGTNHGSLSDRILSRYGDTPAGMVESALEFLRICRDENYHNLVLSMKSSNPQVMVEAYRLLVNKMDSEQMFYPLHLGVTEAGEGDDGRIKSALGIGCLLEDGIGDTIRVSLTEDPEFEIPVAKKLTERYASRVNHSPVHSVFSESVHQFSPFEYQKRESRACHNLGGKNVPRVIADFSHLNTITEWEMKQIGHVYDANLDKWHMTDLGADFLFTGSKAISFMLPNGLKAICNYEVWKSIEHKNNYYPLININDLNLISSISSEIIFVLVNCEEVNADIIRQLNETKNTVLIIKTNNEHRLSQLRQMFFDITEAGCDIPVVIKTSYSTTDGEKMMLHSSTDCGSLLIDGYGDGIWIDAPEIQPAVINSTAFGILQASRTRISKTEYISCPSCGRTLFNLQETTAKIRQVTDHLKGVKIGIMGCIVNGPGEMADADFGYVGTGPGKITLYKGKEVVKRNISSEIAVDELINLIKENGMWIEK